MDNPVFELQFAGQDCPLVFMLIMHIHPHLLNLLFLMKSADASQVKNPLFLKIVKATDIVFVTLYLKYMVQVNIVCMYPHCLLLFVFPMKFVIHGNGSCVELINKIQFDQYKCE